MLIPLPVHKWSTLLRRGVTSSENFYEAIQQRSTFRTFHRNGQATVKCNSVNDKQKYSESDENLENRRRMQSIQGIFAASSLFMVLWVFSPFPGSAFVGFQWHDELVHKIWRLSPFISNFVPESLLLKYTELGPAPGILHAVPSAIWCALAPLQLYPPVREWAIRAGLHAPAGRAMLAAAAAAMCGVALIDAGGLFADVADFEGHGGALASLVDSAGALPAPMNHIGMRGLAVWFAATGALSWAAARRRDWAAHRRWAIRHAGAGLWVAAQRPLFSVARAVQIVALGSAADGSAAQADVFYAAAYVVTLAYAVMAEWYARADEPSTTPRPPPATP